MGCLPGQEGAARSPNVGAGPMCSRSGQGGVRWGGRKWVQDRPEGGHGPLTQGLGGPVWASASALPQTGRVAMSTGRHSTYKWVAGDEWFQGLGEQGAGEWPLTDGYRVSFQNDENVMELRSSLDLHSLAHTLNTIKFYTVIGWILCYVNYIFKY